VVLTLSCNRVDFAGKVNIALRQAIRIMGR
jgi:hypothetical protein